MIALRWYECERKAGDPRVLLVVTDEINGRVERVFCRTGSFVKIRRTLALRIMRREWCERFVSKVVPL